MTETPAASGELSEDVLQHLYKILVGDLPICGCGNPETAYALVHELLKLAPFYDHSDEITALIGTEGVYYIVLGAMDAADLIEHGGSIGGSWLTAKGSWCLRALNAGGDIEDLSDRLLAIGFPHNGGDCADKCWADS